MEPTRKGIVFLSNFFMSQRQSCRQQECHASELGQPPSGGSWEGGDAEAFSAERRTAGGTLAHWTWVTAPSQGRAARRCSGRSLKRGSDTCVREMHELYTTWFSEIVHQTQLPGFPYTTVNCSLSNPHLRILGSFPFTIQSHPALSTTGEPRVISLQRHWQVGCCNSFSRASCRLRSEVLVNNCEFEFGGFSKLERFGSCTD